MPAEDHPSLRDAVLAYLLYRPPSRPIMADFATCVPTARSRSVGHQVMDLPAARSTSSSRSSVSTSPVSRSSPSWPKSSSWLQRNESESGLMLLVPLTVCRCSGSQRSRCCLNIWPFGNDGRIRRSSSCASYTGRSVCTWCIGCTPYAADRVNRVFCPLGSPPGRGENSVRRGGRRAFAHSAGSGHRLTSPPRYGRAKTRLARHRRPRLRVRPPTRRPGRPPVRDRNVAATISRPRGSPPARSPER